MAHWLKAIPAVLLLSALSFAQYDYDSEGESEATETPSEIETPATTGSATATGDEWDGFRIEEMGLTQWEFQQAKEGGVSRNKLTHLVELGIRPTEYLQKPWLRLGVGEEAWLEQRAQGLEDSDIDRSYRNKSEQQKKLKYICM